MTPDEIAAERERFIDAWMRSGKSFDLRFDHENRKFIAWEVENHWWFSWLKRAAIARAEHAELRAENERLRERVRVHARARLFNELANAHKLMGAGSAKHMWDMQHPELLQLAEEAGVWFDDQGNEVPLAEWRERMGGAG